MTECEEAGCTRAATKNWKGRQVCDDHYDSYRDAEEKRINDMSF